MDAVMWGRGGGYAAVTLSHELLGRWARKMPSDTILAAGDVTLDGQKLANRTEKRYVRPN